MANNLIIYLFFTIWIGCENDWNHLLNLLLDIEDYLYYNK